MNKSGEQFLHKKDPRLQRSGPVEHEQKRRKRAGEETSQKPANKLAAWMKVLEKTHLGHRDDPRVLERIKRSYEKEYVTITLDDIPQNYWNNKARIMIEQGFGGDMEQAGVIKQLGIDKKGNERTDYIFPEDLKQQELDLVVSNQKRSLDKWIDELTSEDAVYPTWAKYWAFTTVVKMGKFEKVESKDGKEIKERARFQKRTKDTTASFPLLNHRALAKAIGVMNARLEEKQKAKKDRSPIINESGKLSDPEFEQLLSSENFSKLYAQFLLEMPEYSTEGLQETRGEWVKYEQGSDPDELVKSIEGYPLEWCTADIDTARTQLESGDFYIYYSINDDQEVVIPRLAIRMQGSKAIAEPPRGIASDQNLDPYIAPVLEEKLKEFGKEGEAYQKKVADMEKLTQIETKNKFKIKLEKDDLSFLYEIDSPIEGFGYEKDPRVEELRQNRDPEQDMLIIIECSPDQIAHNASEINKDTKAYLGKLEPGVFDHGLEHIYTSFPEGKIPQYNIEIGGKTKDQLKQELKANNIYITGWADDLMESKEFTISKNVEEADLVRLTVKDFGFESDATTKEIFKKAQELGLELCPAETGPHLRLQYPGKEWTNIGMKQITDRDGDPDVFGLDWDGDQLGLGARSAEPSCRWYPDDKFVFRLRKSDS